jgi:2-polyprenyl-6-methoxyphenol hydroxylase-like FAD-dependent oxidoreductase
MAAQETRVVIVGGGPVGLCAGLFLAHHGVRTMVAERLAARPVHPRARGVVVRTMELFRELGLETQVRRVARRFPGNDSWVAVDTLTRANLASGRRTGEFGGCQRYEEYSPTAAMLCPQYALEPILLGAARDAGVELRFGTEVTAFSHDDDGVSVVFRDSTGQRVSRYAEYVIGADGPRSTVRALLGSGMSGVQDFGGAISVFFRADLGEAVSGHDFAGCWIRTPAARGTLLPADDHTSWIYLRRVSPGERAADYPPGRCRELIRIAVATPALDIDIVSVLRWRQQAGVAENFASGRVFLAGDAAHVMPIAGGFGANAGIQDAHNLAWKLAARLAGTGGAGLLDSYQAERKKIAEFTVRQAVLRTVHPDLRWDRAGTQRRAQLGMAEALAVQLAYRYGAGVPPAAPPAPGGRDGTARLLHGLPGTRVPHAWVGYHGRRVSTLDLLGSGFVLLTGPDGERWCRAARHAAAARGVRLAAYRVGPAGDLVDPEAEWAQRAGVGTSGALLVRPDGFVAWRGSDDVTAQGNAVAPADAGEPASRIVPALSAALGW